MFGSLRRTSPVRRHFGWDGWDRGTPVDRYYAERFLSSHAADVEGRVLEVGDRLYTRRFGGDRVTRSDVLSLERGRPDTTIVADLRRGGCLKPDVYDCVILTFVLGFIFDVRPAIRQLHDSLKPGGILLLVDSGIRSVSRYDMDAYGDYWRFTSRSLRELVEEVFQPEDVEVEVHGNVLSAVCFLHGILAEELTASELDRVDEDYETVVALRARKRDASGSDERVGGAAGAAVPA